MPPFLTFLAWLGLFLAAFTAILVETYLATRRLKFTEAITGAALFILAILALQACCLLAVWRGWGG